MGLIQPERITCLSETLEDAAANAKKFAATVEKIRQEDYPTSLWKNGDSIIIRPTVSHGLIPHLFYNSHAILNWVTATEASTGITSPHRDLFSIPSTSLPRFARLLGFDGDVMLETAKGNTVHKFDGIPEYCRGFARA